MYNNKLNLTPEMLNMQSNNVNQMPMGMQSPGGLPNVNPYNAGEILSMAFVKRLKKKKKGGK